MRVIQMTADAEVVSGGEGNKNPRDPDRTRDLFGIQLEVAYLNGDESRSYSRYRVCVQVTSLLLESEHRKLFVLQRELRGALNREAGSLKAKERQQHELILAIS